MHFTGYVPPDEFWAMNDRMDQQVRANAGALPLFRIVDWEGPVMLGSWQLDGSEGGVAHGDPFPADPRHPGPRIDVVTSARKAEDIVRNRSIISGGPPRSKEDLLSRYEEFNAIPGDAVSIPIDGVGTPFTLWREPGIWWAAGSYGDFGIAIEAKGPGTPEPERVSLETVPDIEVLLRARREMIKAARGEA